MAVGFLPRKQSGCVFGPALQAYFGASNGAGSGDTMWKSRACAIKMRRQTATDLMVLRKVTYARADFFLESARGGVVDDDLQ